MALKIFKYPIGDDYSIMPVGAQILSAQEQGGILTLWAIVDDDVLEHEQRRIIVLGTGFDVPHYLSKDNFISTVQAHDGLVWHIFEHNPS